MTRLWDRGEPLDAVVERLTVGRDPELDLRLTPFDALASAAHAEMLRSIGLLDDDELAALERELAAIASETRDGSWRIDPADEDGHTAIENRLTERLGDAGRRIHAGRSRNDQVLAALRLWGREAILDLHGATLEAAGRLLGLAAEHREAPMPGYSHTRQAMPTTFGHYWAGWAEPLLDDLPWLRRAYAHLDRSPLGSASGFGTALPVDRQRVAARLGFERLERNTLAVQNSRGKDEWLALGAAAAVATDLGRLATDLIRLSAGELGFVRLPEALTTGSSIMPQKRNPDLLELVRAGAARVRARHAEIAAVHGPLGSGYHRDLQLAKEPFLEGMALTRDLLTATEAVLAGIEIDGERARRAIETASGATDALYARVAGGEPFRSAYRAVAADPEAAVAGDPADAWRGRTHAGAPGEPEPDHHNDRVTAERRWLDEHRALVAEIWRRFES